MSDLLSEDELNALSEGVADGSIPVDTGFNTRTKVRKHDLASEDSTLGVNLGSVEMINERFIRLFRLGLVEVLRSTPKILGRNAMLTSENLLINSSKFLNNLDSEMPVVRNIL